MRNRVYEYIKDDEFRFTIFSNRVHVMNYKEILSLESERISFSSNQERVVMKGKNLTLNQLLDQELLILGDISTIEVFHD